MADHEKIRIRYNIYKTGEEWTSDETVEFYVNDIITKVHHHEDGTYCEDGNYEEMIDIQMPHSAEDITFEFRTGFDEEGGYWD